MGGRYCARLLKGLMELTAESKQDMFWMMLLSRRLDERAWELRRQGKIAFHISAIGHEAAQVGIGFAMRRGYDWLAPYYRDLSLMLTMGFSPQNFLLGLMGKKEEPISGGRQMPFHWSDPHANVLSVSMAAASQTALATGAALSLRMKKEDSVVVTTCGDGATSQGVWYESVNFAAVHKLPLVFVVENNLYSVSVPLEKQMAVAKASDRAAGLGLPGYSVDGLDVFKVYTAMKKAIQNARIGLGPSIVETRVFRITPHSSDDDDRLYRTRQEVEFYQQRDPLRNVYTLLEKEGLINAEILQQMEKHAVEVIDEAVAYAENALYPQGDEAAGPLYAEARNDG